MYNVQTFFHFQIWFIDYFNLDNMCRTCLTLYSSVFVCCDLLGCFCLRLFILSNTESSRHVQKRSESDKKRHEANGDENMHPCNLQLEEYTSFKVLLKFTFLIILLLLFIYVASFYSVFPCSPLVSWSVSTTSDQILIKLYRNNSWSNNKL